MASAPQSGVAPANVACPACQTVLKIRMELVGKRVKCRCGQVFQAPTLREMEDAVSQAAAERALSRGYMPAHKRVITEDENPLPTYNALLDLYLPLALLPAGAILALLQAMYFEKHEHSFAQAIGPTLIVIIASVGLMVAAVLGAALFLGMVFHTRPRQTALKIAACALLPGPVGGIVDHVVGGMNGNILGVLSAVALYTALVKLILRQTWENTAVIVFACWTIRTFTLYAIYKCQGAASGSWF
jgi:hypothetical protein